jgi:MFS family permease
MAPQTAPARLFYGWIVLAACFLITFLASGTMMAFGIFINPMADDMGWSHSALSFTYAISSIVSGLGILGVGTLMHAHSVRQLLLLGTLIHGVGLYATSTVTSVEGFYFWYGLVTSLGRSVFLISTAALITRWFEKRQGFAMGLTMAGNGLGPFIFSPLVTWVILRWDWQTAFVMLSVTVSATSVLACLFLRNYPHEMGLVPFGVDRDAAPPTTPSGSQRSTRSVGSVWRDILRMEGFWTLAVINFFCCMCHSVPLVHIVVFAQHAGLSSFASAWVLALMSLSAVAGRVAWGVFADRHGARLTLIFTLFIQGTLVLWLVNAEDPAIFFLYALFWGFGYGGVNTQYGVVAREIYGPRGFGPGYSGQMCFAMVGMATGGFLGGYLYDISNGYAVSWLISFAAGLVSALLAMDLMSQAEKTQAATVPETPAPIRTTRV